MPGVLATSPSLTHADVKAIYTCLQFVAEGCLSGIENPEERTKIIENRNRFKDLEKTLRPKVIEKKEFEDVVVYKHDATLYTAERNGVEVWRIAINRECVGGCSVPDYSDVMTLFLNDTKILHGNGSTWATVNNIDEAYWYAQGAIAMWSQERRA